MARKQKQWDDWISWRDNWRANRDATCSRPTPGKTDADKKFRDQEWQQHLAQVMGGGTAHPAPAPPPPPQEDKMSTGQGFKLADQYPGSSDGQHVDTTDSSHQGQGGNQQDHRQRHGREDEMVGNNHNKTEDSQLQINGEGAKPNIEDTLTVATRTRRISTGKVDGTAGQIRISNFRNNKEGDGGQMGEEGGNGGRDPPRR